MQVSGKKKFFSLAGNVPNRQGSPVLQEGFSWF